MADKKISPKAPAAKDKKESGKTEAATRVSRFPGSSGSSGSSGSRSSYQRSWHEAGLLFGPGLIALGPCEGDRETDVTTLAPVPTTEMSDALLEGMAGTPLFEGASQATISRLAAQGVTRRFRRGTYLFHQGDEAPDVYFLVSGRVEISSLSSDGRRQLHDARRAAVLRRAGRAR